jgi:hypothetical protein
LARNTDFTCANLFWWFNLYGSADIGVTHRPMYPADGCRERKSVTYLTGVADNGAASGVHRGASSLSDLGRSTAEKRTSVPYVRSFSSNSYGYSPQTTGQMASKPLSLATTA